MKEGGTNSPKDQRKKPSASDGKVEQNSHMKTFWYVPTIYFLVYNYNTLILSCSNDESDHNSLVGRTLYIKGENNDPVLITVNSITLDHNQKIPVAHLFKCVDQTTTKKHKLMQDTIDDEDDPETLKMSVQALNRQLSHLYSNSDLQITNLVRHESTPSGIIILTEWNTGESSWTPLKHLCDHDLPRVIEYAEDHNLEDTIGWKWVRRSKRALARQSLKIRRLMSPHYDYSSTRRIGNRRAPREIKYDVEVPRGTKDALQLDCANRNNLWKSAIQKELNTLASYNTFKRVRRRQIPKNYNYIPLHFVFDVKSDGTRKARLVAGGHIISSPDCPLYSSVVKTESVRTIMTIAAKQGLQVITGDVGGAYLNAPCAEKVWTYTMDANGLPDKDNSYVTIIIKNLYGLKSGASSWWIHFATTLRRMGFFNSKADNNVWLQPRYNNCNALNGYDFIIVHVDDFMILARDAEQYMTKLQTIYKIRHVTPIDESTSTYLGMDIRRQAHGKPGFLLSASTYLKQALSTARIIFDYDTYDDIKGRNTVLDKDKDYDNEDTDLLNPIFHKKYLKLVGILNWLSELGRIDITYATRKLSTYNASPRIVHWEALRHIFGYLKKHNKYALPIDPSPLKGEPGMPIEVKNFDSELHLFKKLYPDAHEDIDINAIPGISCDIDITIYVDATWASDNNRRSITGFIIYFGSSPITWYSGKQSQVEGSTYASEFCALRKAIEALRGVRYTLRSFGIKVNKPNIIYCDNRSVCSNVELANSFLKKRHVGIAYHLCREAVAAGIARISHVKTTHNRADILTKILGPSLQYAHCDRIFPKVNRDS